MPKVTQEYRDARRDQILTAARRCFVRQGFQKTSMHDLFAESGLSSGAFYLYFASKEDVIVAIAEDNIGTVAALIDDLGAHGHLDRASLGDTLATVLRAARRDNREDDLGAMAVLVWSEALRSPLLRSKLTDVVRRLRGRLTAVLAQAQAAGTVTDAASADALARLLLTIVPGAILQLALFGDRALDGVPQAVEALWP